MDTDSNKSKFQTSIVPKYIITMLEFGICLKKGYYFDPPVTKIQSSVRRNISILIDEGPVLVYQRTKAKLCTVGGGSFLFPPVQFCVPRPQGLGSVVRSTMLRRTVTTCNCKDHECCHGRAAIVESFSPWACNLQSSRVHVQRDVRWLSRALLGRRLFSGFPSPNWSGAQRENEYWTVGSTRYSQYHRNLSSAGWWFGANNRWFLINETTAQSTLTRGKSDVFPFFFLQFLRRSRPRDKAAALAGEFG